MNIIIENIGPIRKAKFDLSKKLSVFCGPNNTGKTYLSYVLYAFTRRRIYMPDYQMSEEQVNEFLTKKALTVPLNTAQMHKALTEKMHNIKKDLGIIFGLSGQSAKTLFPDFRMKLDMTAKAYQDMVLANSYDIVFHLTRNVAVQLVKKHGDSIVTIKNLSATLDKDDRDAIKYNLLFAAYHHLTVSPIFDSRFFPVERTSMYTYHKDILGTRNKLIDILHAQDAKEQQQTIGFVLNNSTQFPLALAQTLEAAGNMSRNKDEEGHYWHLADEIEHDILQGKVSVSDEGDMRFTSDMAPEKTLPIQLSASIDKAIVGIVFYLRHLSGKDDMVFIDEPEVNCHPSVQVQLTRVFAKMVNAGLRLVVSTHSDYIIHELNNLIMLSEATNNIAGQLKDWGYQKQMALRHEDVAAYLFAYGKNNKVDVKPIKVTDTGFEVTTIDDTINRMNEVSQTLYYEMRYGKEE